jgi:hypothetical protein
MYKHIEMKYKCNSGLKMISTTSRNIQCLSCKHNYLNRICSIYTGVGKEIRFEKTEGNG